MPSLTTRRRSALRVEVLEDRVVPSLMAGTTQVNTTPLVPAAAAKVTTANASTRDGSSVVVWTHRVGQASDIYAQLFNADRSRRGSEIHVAATAALEFDPSVGMDRAGNFVVSWTVQRANGDKDVRAARYSRLGVAQGAPFNVAVTARAENASSVARAANGDFVISFVRTDPTTGENIYLKRFAANGTAQGTLTVAATKADEHAPAAAFSPGKDARFAVAYQVGYDVWLKRYSATGQVLGTHVLASSKFNESVPSLSMDNAGNCAVAWQQILDGTISADGIKNQGAWAVHVRTVSRTGAVGNVTEAFTGSSDYFIDGSGGDDQYTDCGIALAPTGGRFVVTALHTSNVNDLFEGPSGSVSVEAAEFGPGGTNRKFAEVAVLVQDSSSNVPASHVYPALSIGGTGQYAVSYVDLAMDSADAGATTTPSVALRAGKL